MKESVIENYLKNKVKSMKGIAIKLNSMSMSGLPDRMVLLPKGIILFVELKRLGGKARPLQLVTHRLLKNLGFEVYVIDSKKQVEEALNKYGEV